MRLSSIGPWHRASLLTPVALIVGSQGAQAQTAALSAAAEAAEQPVTEVVVTGTRIGNLQASQSPSPVQILSPQALQAASGNPDLMTTLAQIVPSLQAEIHGGDMEQQTLQMKLRGLSPNDVLVLVNGKRRHTTANLGIDGGPYQGGAGVDLNFIPLEAIDHIEVLTDGAAAQYGSDAIAGVINIILKKKSSGGDLAGVYGGYYDGGGDTHDLDANAGLEPADAAYLNVTGSDHNHGTSLRSGPDPRATSPTELATYPNSNMTRVPGYPFVNLINGDGDYRIKVAELNSGIRFNDALEIYLFATYGHKTARSNQNYRLPSQAHFTLPSGTIDYPLPFGFQPSEATQETDYQVTGGLKGTLAGWNWDLGSSFGEDSMDVYTTSSINSSVFNMNGLPQPSNFFDGTLQASQWATTLDINRDFNVGLAGPLNFAVGAEYRRDTYGIQAGQLLSYEFGGAQSFPGWTPQDATSQGRKNVAGYLDLDAKLTEQLRIDLAGRYEHYSDFGDARVGKLTARYDFTASVALRGTISNGFRAPTLAEEYYASTNVSPTSANVQLAPNSSVASLLGLGQGLQPEKSRNYSAGIVLRPAAAMLMTLDVYQITLTNRIVGTSTLTGEQNGTLTSPTIIEAIQASGAPVNGDVTSYGIDLFTNGINTRTRGADLVLDYPIDYSFGHIDWSVGGNYNDTVVTGLRSTPSQVLSISPVVTNSLFNVTSTDALTTESPKYVVNLGALWTYGRLSVSVLEKLYGPSSAWSTDGGYNPTKVAEYFDTTVGFTPITNLDIGVRLLDHLKIDVGANNLFNRYPNGTNPTLLEHLASGLSTGAMAIYASFAPYGDDGGFYFARATFTW